MTDATLFPLHEQPSPRLRWMARHDLTLFTRADGTWAAYQRGGAGVIGTGHDQDEALTDLAHKLGLRLWNEETA